MTRLTVETHAHTKYSKDCLMEPARIIDVCRARGIDRLCITDHNTMRGAFALAQLAPDLIIPGEEIMTTQGELLGYYMTEEIPAGLSPLETIDRLRTQGAAISVAHPFDVHRRGHWQPEHLAAILPHVDAIEIFNSRCLFPSFNRRAQDYARQHQICGTIGSDAHSYRELGCATLRLPPFTNAQEFIASLKHAEYHMQASPPLVRLSSRWAVLVKLLRGGNPPP